MYTAEDIIWATREARHRPEKPDGRLLSRGGDQRLSQMIALEHLDASGGLGPSELARRLQMTTGAVTALVDRLEAGGYVARAAHPSDRRRLVIAQKADDDITEEAAPLVMEILELAESFDRDELQAVGRFLTDSSTSSSGRLRRPASAEATPIEHQTSPSPVTAPRINRGHDMAKNITDERRLSGLRWWNLIVGLILAVQAAAIAVLTNDFSLPVTSTHHRAFLGTPLKLNTLF